MASLTDNIQSLVVLMHRLRDFETGCPWDQQQSFQSIAPHTLAETYEVLDAIMRDNRKDLCEELGDLFFQVLFYSEIATEENSFSLNDVFEQLLKKMLHRHPHVFPDGTLDSKRSPGPVELPDWNALKRQERLLKCQASEEPVLGSSGTSLLTAVKTSTPPMRQSIELQRLAATVGFDWPDAASTLAKLDEEVRELLQALTEQEAAQQDLDAKNDQYQQAIEEEFGDLFFSLMNTARKLSIDPELCLMKANIKFRKRFLGMERAASDLGTTLEQMSDAELEAVWEQVKQAEQR